MKKYYRIAGLDICLDIPQNLGFCDSGKLAAFVAGACENCHRYSLEVTDRLDSPCGELVYAHGSMSVYRDANCQLRYYGSRQSGGQNAYMRGEYAGMHHRIQLHSGQIGDSVGVKTVLGALALEHFAAHNGGFLFHCAYIQRQGRAILFTAPSGTGKSTQAELWKKLRGSRIVNGDRAAVRQVDGIFYAEGIPFAGSSDYCENISSPLEAVVYLSQAPKTTIRRMRGSQAFLKIWEGVSVNTWDAEDMAAVSDTVRTLAEKVPVYYLSCTPDESAVQALEQCLARIGDEYA